MFNTRTIPRAPLLLALSALLLTGTLACQRDRSDTLLPTDRSGHTHIQGTITVDPAIDASADYSGIRVLVLGNPTLASAQNNAGGVGTDTAQSPSTLVADTLYRAVTDTTGYFEGLARIPADDIYRLRVYRREFRLADTTLVLAVGDTVRIEGMLPRFSGRASIDSRENNAMRTLNRLDRQYNRIYALAAIGAVPADSIPAMQRSWSNIYWEMFESAPNTVAGAMAAEESLQLVGNRDDALLMSRLRDHGQNEVIRGLAATYGFLGAIRTRGLDDAVTWMDSLSQQMTDRDNRILLEMNLIEVLYDSARTALASERIERFTSNYADEPLTASWLASFRYDIEHLSAGMPLPDFSLPVTLPGAQTDSMQLAALSGGPALIEVARISDAAYQAYFSELNFMYDLYEPQGVSFFTIPAENSRVTVSAFFAEREQRWPVAQAGALAESDLAERWNLYELPTRFLIDGQGRIIRKFHGHDLTEVQRTLQSFLTNGEVL